MSTISCTVHIQDFFIGMGNLFKMHILKKWYLLICSSNYGYFRLFISQQLCGFSYAEICIVSQIIRWIIWPWNAPQFEHFMKSDDITRLFCNFANKFVIDHDSKKDRFEILDYILADENNWRLKVSRRLWWNLNRN